MARNASDGRCDNLTADTDSHKDMEKGPFFLSGCRPGQNIVPECEVFLDGEGSPELKLKECQKNPGHENFIPVKDFTMEHLPEKIRTEDKMKCINAIIDLTVLVRVTYTSVNRPDIFYDSKAPYPFSDIRGKPYARTGTGFIISSMAQSKPEIGVCPCLSCRKSGNPQTKYWKYRVYTATHVVFDDAEAERTVIKCFYDCEEDFKTVVKLYGVKLENRQSLKEMYHTDVCDGLLCVTHDEQSAQTIKSRLEQWSSLKFSAIPTMHDIIISHPHGCSKMVSIGKVFYMTVHIRPGYEFGKREHFSEDAIGYISDSTGEDFTAHILCSSKLKTFLSRFKGLFKERDIYHHKGSTFTLPNDAEYFFRYYYDRRAFVFPPGTTLNTGGGDVLIPDNSTFVNLLMTDYTLYHRHASWAYAIPTCPGSSGALIDSERCFECYDYKLLDEGKHRPESAIPHCGWDRQGQCNRSSFTNVEIFNGYLKDVTTDL